MLQDHIDQVASDSTRRDIEGLNLTAKNIDLFRREVYTAVFLQFMIVMVVVVGVAMVAVQP